MSPLFLFGMLLALSWLFWLFGLLLALELFLFGLLLALSWLFGLLLNILFAAPEDSYIVIQIIIYKTDYHWDNPKSTKKHYVKISISCVPTISIRRLLIILVRGRFRSFSFRSFWYILTPILLSRICRVIATVNWNEFIY